MFINIHRSQLGTCPTVSSPTWYVRRFRGTRPTSPPPYTYTPCNLKHGRYASSCKFFLEYTSPMKRQHLPARATRITPRGGHPMRETSPHTTALTINAFVRLDDATTMWSPHSVGVKKREETQAVSGRTFHANQSPTPGDCLPYTWPDSGL